MKSLFLIILSVLLIIWMRLFYLQVYKGDYYTDLSRQITLRHQTILAPRGVISDRNGKVMADNHAIIEAYLNRQEARRANWVQWATLLDSTPGALQEKWDQAKKTPAFKPYLLVSGLSLDHLLRWKQVRLDEYLAGTHDWQGLELRYRPARQYSFRPEEARAFSHLLGYIRSVTPADLATRADLIAEDVIGASGIERYEDNPLRGKNGDAWLWVDAYGRQGEAEANSDFSPHIVPAKPGKDLTLTIDADLQVAAYDMFAGRPGALVAMHLPDGELYSLVSSPGLDSNDFIGGISSKKWKALLEDPLNPLLNRAVQAAYPPGSTYKMVTAAAGLESGKLKETDDVHCPGYFVYGGHRFNCWNKRGHGRVNLKKALEASCDVFFYQLGLKLDVDDIAAVAKRFGLGEQTALAFPFERGGFIPSRDGLKERYRQSFSRGHIFSLMIGQGSNLTTPLQAALMIGRLARNSQAIRPHLFRSQTPPWGLSRPLLSPEHHQIIADGLNQVVYGASGTAGRLRSLPFTLAGKTGTSQAGGNRDDHAWFVAYAPAEHPEIAVAVIVEHGGHGSSAAAPIAGEYLKRYFERYPAAAMP